VFKLLRKFQAPGALWIIAWHDPTRSTATADLSVEEHNPYVRRPPPTRSPARVLPRAPRGVAPPVPLSSSVAVMVMNRAAAGLILRDDRLD